MISTKPVWWLVATGIEAHIFTTLVRVYQAASGFRSEVCKSARLSSAEDEGMSQSLSSLGPGNLDTWFITFDDCGWDFWKL